MANALATIKAGCGDDLVCKASVRGDRVGPHEDHGYVGEGEEEVGRYSVGMLVYSVERDYRRGEGEGLKRRRGMTKVMEGLDVRG